MGSGVRWGRASYSEWSSEAYSIAHDTAMGSRDHVRHQIWYALASNIPRRDSHCRRTFDFRIDIQTSNWIPPTTTLDRLGTILHTSINLAEEISRRRVTSDQQWPRPHFSECITSPFARSIPLIMKYLIQPWFECFRADLATNAHCSLAVALLFSMPRGVFRPPCGYFSFRSELRRRDSRDSMTWTISRSLTNPWDK